MAEEIGQFTGAVLQDQVGMIIHDAVGKQSKLASPDGILMLIKPAAETHEIPVAECLSIA